MPIFRSIGAIFRIADRQAVTYFDAFRVARPESFDHMIVKSAPQSEGLEHYIRDNPKSWVTGIWDLSFRPALASLLDVRRPDFKFLIPGTLLWQYPFVTVD
jgi:hypothetical protein